MKKILVLLICTLVLFGCGGGGGGGDTECRNASLSDMVGTWDYTEDYGSEGTDVYYIKISADGTWSDYDYYGDTFDNGQDCYEVDHSSINGLGAGNFVDGDQVPFKAEICGSSLRLTENRTSITLPKTNKSDFTPICR